MLCLQGSVCPAHPYTRLRPPGLLRLIRLKVSRLGGHLELPATFLRPPL